jgi:hypothetical protein
MLSAYSARLPESTWHCEGKLNGSAAQHACLNSRNEKGLHHPVARAVHWMLGYGSNANTNSLPMAMVHT